MKRGPILLIIILFSIHAFSSQSKVDSLKTILKTSKEDSNKVVALNALCWELKFSDPDSSLLLADQALALSEKIKYQNGKSISLRNKGVVYYLEEKSPEALRFYFESLKISATLKDLAAMAATEGNIAIVYDGQADYTHALEYYFKALKLALQMHDKDREAIQLGNIGNVYKEMGDYTKALDFSMQAVKLDEEIGRQDLVSVWLGNIGNAYQERSEYAKALQYYLKALQLSEKGKNENAQAATICNIGDSYLGLADSLSEKDKNASEKLYAKSLEQYERAFELAKKLEYQELEAVVLCNLGAFYYKRKEYSRSEQYFKNSLALYDSIGGMDGVRDVERSLSSLDSLHGDFKNALLHYKKYIAARDSISNDENIKKQTRTEMQFDFDKEQAADSIKNAEQEKQENIKHDQEIHQQKLYTYGGVIGFILMLVIAGVSFRAFRQKQSANAVISLQKELVEEKQREILDSIHYAKRIQTALLPTEKYIERTMTRLKKN